MTTTSPFDISVFTPDGWEWIHNPPESLLIIPTDDDIPDWAEIYADPTTSSHLTIVTLTRVVETQGYRTRLTTDYFHEANREESNVDVLLSEAVALARSEGFTPVTSIPVKEGRHFVGFRYDPEICDGTLSDEASETLVEIMEDMSAPARRNERTFVSADDHEELGPIDVEVFPKIEP